MISYKASMYSEFVSITHISHKCMTEIDIIVQLKNILKINVYD